FLAAHATRELSAEDRVRALSVMELARHAMLMYTSCGWFFDDLSGIETVQCMQYAARVAELVQVVRGVAVEAEFVDRIDRRSGRARMVAATVRVKSALTEATTSLCFAVLHLGEQHVTGGVRS